jgi:hypothetical protein
MPLSIALDAAVWKPSFDRSRSFSATLNRMLRIILEFGSSPNCSVAE